MSFSSDPALFANQLPISVDFTRNDLNKLIEEITLLYKRIASSVNTKEGALYNLIEGATFQQYYIQGNTQQFNPVYRKVIDFGALPNSATKSVAHGIAFASTYTMTHVYGAASDPIGLIYLPLPYASTVLNNNIELYVDATNVNITTATNDSAYTRCSVVLEYTKI